MTGVVLKRVVKKYLAEVYAGQPVGRKKRGELFEAQLLWRPIDTILIKAITTNAI